MGDPQVQIPWVSLMVVIPGQRVFRCAWITERRNTSLARIGPHVVRFSNKGASLPN